MKCMFKNAYNFNQPLILWDTSRVRDMSNMFRNAFEFNQPIHTFNTSLVLNMKNMFYNAHVFNQPIQNWDTSNVYPYPILLHTQSLAINLIYLLPNHK
jgi:hypothetical protein